MAAVDEITILDIYQVTSAFLRLELTIVEGLSNESYPWPGTAEYEEYKRREKRLELIWEVADWVIKSRNYSSEWKWRAAGKALARAYDMLGETNPYEGDPLKAGYALHRGEHPAQADQEEV